MTRFGLILGIAMLAACKPAGPASSDRKTGGPATRATPAAASAALEAKAFKDEGHDDLMDWSLTYPAEIAALPAMANSIRAAFAKMKNENLADAKDLKLAMEKDGAEFHGFEQSERWSVAGNTPALLSASADWYMSTGGAHPNHGTSAILWDRRANRKVSVDSMLIGGAASFAQLFRPAYCAALTAERRSRREGQDLSTDPTDPFNQCPKFSELVIIPTGPARGGPMTRISFHADPYVAGPYVEGDYDVDLPVTQAFLDALRPDYLSSFAVKS